MTGVRLNVVYYAFLIATPIALAACPQPAPPTASTSEAASAKGLAAIKETEAQEQKNLTNFDDLDFNVYTGQKWNELSKSHAPDRRGTGPLSWE